MAILYNLIVAPRENIYLLSRRDLGYGGVWIMLLAVVSASIAPSLILDLPSRLSMYSFTWGILFRLVFFCFCFFILTMIYHYFAGILGGFGDGSKVFKLLLYSSNPFCFITPAVLILKMFAGQLIFFLTCVLLLLFIIWSAFLQYLIINYSYGISKYNALSVILMPWVIFFGMVAFVSVTFGASLVSLVI